MMAVVSRPGVVVKNLRWLVLAAIGGGCTPTKLIKATVEYAQLSDSALGELASVPGMVEEICLERAELEYMTVRVQRSILPLESQTVPTTFAEFFATAETKIGLPGAPTITWKQHCGGYRLPDHAFEVGLQALAEYGIALRGFATEDASAAEHAAAIAGSVADATASLSTTAAPYKDALSGLGTPIGKIADAVKQKWKAKKLRGLIDEVHPHVHAALGTLVEFVTVVKSHQVQDLHDALDMLRETLEARRETTMFDESMLPVILWPKSTPYKIDLVTAMMIDIEISGRITQLERRLTTLVDLLKRLDEAHAELRTGWNKGEGVGQDTLKAIALLGKSIYDDIHAFRNPQRSPP